MRRLLLALALLLGVTAAAQGAELTLVSQGPVRGGWQYIVSSPAAGRDFRVQVAEPDRFPWQRSKLPAIYVLDGDAFFGRARSAAITLADQRKMGRAYVVGVGYPPGTDTRWRRLDDLVHREGHHGGRKVGGAGAAFQAFLIDELQPFLASRYPIDDARSVLVGHSVGGLFAATVMAAQPEAFGGYLVASPSFQFDMPLIARLGAVDGGGRRVFIAAGAAEEPGMVALVQRLAATMGGAGATLQVKQQIFEGANHMGVVSPMLWNGLPYLLPPKGR